MFNRLLKIKMERNTWKERQFVKLRSERKKIKREREHVEYLRVQQKIELDKARELKAKWFRVDVHKDYLYGNDLALNMRFNAAMFGLRRTTDMLDWKKELLEEVGHHLSTELNFREQPKRQRMFDFKNDGDKICKHQKNKSAEATIKYLRFNRLSSL